MEETREKRSYVVDLDSLPLMFPTHLHSAEFWEHLGRTVATFGHLEEVLGKAIFALTATVRWDETEIEGAFERWLPTLERALIDPLGGLIKILREGLSQPPRSHVRQSRRPARRTSPWSAMRNVLCHGSWRKPDARGRSLPLFVNRKEEVFNAPIDIEFLRQTQRAGVELICHVINSITSMGWQFPGTKVPGAVIYQGKTPAS